MSPRRIAPSTKDRGMDKWGSTVVEESMLWQIRDVSMTACLTLFIERWLFCAISFKVLLELAVLFLLAMHIFIQPYKTRVANVVEALVLLDLAIIGSLTLQQDERSIPTAVFFTLVILPLAYLLVYLTAALWRHIQQIRLVCLSKHI